MGTFAYRHVFPVQASSLGVHHRFFVGAGPNIRYDLLAADVVGHDDVVYYDAIDSYNNLTIKVAAMLQWHRTFCPGAAHLLKLGEDVLVHFPRLLYLMADGFGERTGVADWIVGKREAARQVVRQPGEKS